MKKIIFTILCLLGFIIISTNNFAKSISLKQAKDLAVSYNVKIKNAKLDVRIARKKIWETTAIGLPQISSKLEYQDIPNIPTTLIPAKMFDSEAPDGKYLEMKFGTQHNASLSLIVNQLIFKGGYIVGLQASKIYLKLSKDLLKKTEQEVKEEVSETYFLSLLAREIKDILIKSIENIKKTYYETKELYKTGFLEATDVDQIKLSITNLENNLNSIKRQETITLRLLKFQMGLKLDSDLSLSDTLEYLVKNINKAELLKNTFNVESYIDFIMLDTQEKSKNLLLKNEKSEFLPVISAYFLQKSSAMRNEFNFFRKNDDKWFSSTVIGLNIQLPIFDSGYKLARIGQANLELKKARNAKEESRKGLIVSWQKAKSEFEDAFDKLTNIKESVVLAKRVFVNNEIKFKNGTVSSMELIQSHNQYLNAQSNYIRNIVAVLNAKLKLAKFLNKI